MPFRALLWMVISIGLALLAVSLWVRAVQPMLEAEPNAGASPTTRQVAGHLASTHPADISHRSLQLLVRGVLLLSFLLLCLLLIVGVVAALRETLRVRAGVQTFSSKKQKTTYTDAWRLAGRRVDLPAPTEDSPHEKGTDEDGPPTR